MGSDEAGLIAASLYDPNRLDDGLAASRSSNGSTDLVLNSELALLAGVGVPGERDFEECRSKRLPVRNVETKCLEERWLAPGARVHGRKEKVANLPCGNNGAIGTG